MLVFNQYTRIVFICILISGFISPLSAKRNKISVQEATISYSSRTELPSVLDESSGLLWWNGKLWSHNDSSGADSIYAFAASNPKSVEQYYAGAPNKDWEAMEMDDEYIYIGDFGNNKRIQRTDLRIFKIEKQSLLNGTPAVDTIFFSYPEQTDFADRPKTENTDFDCEAFIITTDSIYLFSKQWISGGTALYSLPKTPGTHTANYISSYNINGLVTDAAYLPEKRMLALCGYSSSYLRQFIYIFYDFEGRHFFDGEKYNFTLNLGLFPHQIEGIATEDGRTYYVTNEYTAVSPQRLHTFDVGSFFENYLLRPETAEKIFGPEIVCQDNMPTTYMIPPVYQAESYEWELPQGAKGISISNSISIYFDTASISGNVAVRGVNKHGYGGYTTLPVSVTQKPATPTIFITKHHQNILQSSSPVGNQWYNHEGRIRGATSQQYEVTAYSDYYVVVTIDGCSSERSNIIKKGCYIELEEPPLIETAPVEKPTDAQRLLQYKKEDSKKKKRKGLFRRK